MKLNQPSRVSALSILVIDDDPDHTELFRIAAEELGVSVQAIHSGKSGLDWLSHAVEKQCLPDIILIDLNMPEMHGFEVLAELKSDDRLRFIPVIMLSCSDAEIDVLSAYERGANTYLTKPSDFRKFRKLVHAIVEYLGHQTTVPGLSRAAV